MGLINHIANELTKHIQISYSCGGPTKRRSQMETLADVQKFVRLVENESWLESKEGLLEEFYLEVDAILDAILIENGLKKESGIVPSPDTVLGHLSWDLFRGLVYWAIERRSVV